MGWFVCLYLEEDQMFSPPLPPAATRAQRKRGNRIVDGMQWSWWSVWWPYKELTSPGVYYRSVEHNTHGVLLFQCHCLYNCIHMSHNLICTDGLIYLCVQERVMTRTYGGESFKDSQFLVFINRILALLVAGVYVFSTAQPRHVGPVYKYSLSSISNILSSWCQYEALKYVTFPTQVLAKSSKVIPVMLMGKVVSGRTYPWHEYLTALLLSAGVSLFLLSKEEPGHSHTTETTVAGVIILIGYMGFDSFTSNWQSKLFTQYHMSSFQMMLGVNLFSSALTLVSMVVRGTLFANLSFLFRHSEFLYHAVLLSVCSAVGQLFIYFTIKEFGPLVFTLIMTTRQALSILLSCIVYGHPLDIQAMLGVGLVFVALFLRVYLNQRQKKLKSTSSSLAGSATASPTPQK